jgi:hypothetical protein
VLTLWLSKPALDRVLIITFGDLQIGKRPQPPGSVRRMLSSSPGALLSELTWFRLIPWRLYLLPVRLLEGQRGEEFRRRCRALAAEWSWHGAALRFFSFCVEWSAFFACIGIVELLLPVELFGVLGGEEAPLPALLLVLIYAVAMSMAEVLHASSAFGLYINRRIWLEGWDIERKFTAIAQRLNTNSGMRRASSSRSDRSGFRGTAGRLLVAGLLCLNLLGPTAVTAASEELPQELGKRISPAQRLELERELETVLEDTEFERYEDAVRWEWRGGEGFRWDAELPEMPLLVAVAELLNRALPWLLIAALLALLVLAYSRYGRRLGKLMGRGAVRRRSGAGPSGGGEVKHHARSEGERQHSQPPGFAARARAAWQEGSREAALRILYLGALTRMVVRTGREPGLSATERERVRIFAGSGRDAGELELFEELTRVWSAYFYGGRLPRDAHFNPLCERWREREEEAPLSPAAPAPSGGTGLSRKEER